MPRLTSDFSDNTNFTSSSTVIERQLQDRRFRLRLPPASDLFYKSGSPGILSPLVDTDGVIFPYQPNVLVSHTANYGTEMLTHSNYAQAFYQGSMIDQITIPGEFTAQNIAEANYMLACIHFLRSCTKMFYGQDGDLNGTPPPILRLSGLGTYMFDSLPVVITNFSMTLPDDVDYIDVGLEADLNISGVFQQFNPNTFEPSPSVQTATAVPTASLLNVVLQPIYSRKQISEEFSLQDYANGSLLKRDNRGGFL